MSGAEYLRKYRANASLAYKEREARRSRAWWQAHRRLAKEYPERFRQLYEEQKIQLREKEARR